MELTLIIRKSGSPVAQCAKTTRSFSHEDIVLRNIIFIDKYSDINYGMINTDWWIVIHDNEMIERQLLEAILIGGKCENFEVFSFYKKDKNFSISLCPRMFRKHVRLEKNALYPVLPVKMEALLDGWVMEHE